MREIIIVMSLFLFISCDSPISVDFEESYGDDWNPISYSCPDSSEADIKVSPKDDLQKIVNKSSPGYKMFFRPGLYVGQSIRPKDDMSFFSNGEAILNGKDRVRFAFSGRAKNVSICGLVIEKYNPGPQLGAIKGGDHELIKNSDGWIIKNSEIRHNHGAGIRTGNGMKILGNFIHHNHQIGIAGSGNNILVNSNEISYNNFQAEYDYNWEAGGTKFVMTDSLEVRNNFVHHNHGSGLWTDIDNRNTLYENNVVEDNADAGIFHEISYRAVIKGNTIRRNGYDRVGNAWAYGAGILIAHSSNVDVYKNTLEDNRNGIIGVQQERGEGRIGPYVLENLSVHNNVIVQRIRGPWAAGVAEDIPGKEVYDRNIEFDHNKYVLISPDKSFYWENKAKNWSRWRVNFSHDVNGSLN